MNQLFADLSCLRDASTTVLLEGESGTGKELVARTLHDQSRPGAPFVVVNCGALDRALARTELFGHRRGSFTGALDAHIGSFEAADGGTLFLDEIGELPLEIQPILLRAVEARAIVRVGEVVERPVRARLIAATNRSLSCEVRAGRFREDLYFRLSVVHLRIPPLRERLEDLPLLAADLARELGVELSPEVVGELTSRVWQGNIRELRNALESYRVFGRLPLPATSPAHASNVEVVGEGLTFSVDPSQPYAAQKERLLEHFRTMYFAALLQRTRGNKAKAARLAGVQRSYLGKVLKGDRTA